VITGQTAGTGTTLVAGNAASGAVNNTNPNNVFTSTSAGITSVVAVMKGGDDSLATDAGGSAFSFLSGFTFDGGDGNNSLDLEAFSATDAVTLGALVYKGLDGTDSLTVGNTTAATTLNSVFVSMGNGGGSVSLTNTKTGTVAVFAGDGTESVSLDTVTGPAAAGPLLLVQGGNGQTMVGVTDSTLGAVKVSAGRQGVAILTAEGTVATRSVSVTGLEAVVSATVGVGNTAWMLAGNLTLTSSFESLLQVSGANRSLTVNGSAVVRSGLISQVSASGDKLDVGGPLVVVSPAENQVTLNSITETKVGSLTVAGASLQTSVSASHTFLATGAVKVIAPGGTNAVTLGEAGTPGASVGSLLMLGGGGTDSVTINQVTVGGPAMILTGGGADSLAIHAGATFQKSLFIDQGAGDDVLSIETTGASPVTFNGRVTVHQGSGNDTLDMDQTQAMPAAFAVAGNLFDGGPGFDDDGNNPNGPPAVGGVTFTNYEV
jgi:hypothetical protein